jgi:hypothetical protein
MHGDAPGTPVLRIAVGYAGKSLNRSSVRHGTPLAARIHRGASYCRPIGGSVAADALDGVPDQDPSFDFLIRAPPSHMHRDSARACIIFARTWLLSPLMRWVGLSSAALPGPALWFCSYVLQQRFSIRWSRAQCRRVQQGCPFNPRPTHQPFGSNGPVSRRPGRH